MHFVFGLLMVDLSLSCPLFSSCFFLSCFVVLCFGLCCFVSSHNVCLFVRSCFGLFVCVFVCGFVCLFVCLFVGLFVCLCVCFFIRLLA